MSAAVGQTIFWIAVLSSVIAELAILRAVFRPSPTVAPTGSPLPRVRRGVEILWAVLPAIALALLLVFTWRAMRANHESPARRATMLAAGSGVHR